MKVKEMQKLSYLKYADFNRRSFLKGAMAVGGALALAGCNQDPVTNTVTVTETQTVTVTESAPTVPENPAEVTPWVTSPSYILPVYSNCVGCNYCMIACCLYHNDELDMRRANIQVHGINLRAAMVDIPVLCMKCSDAPCMAVCPPKVAAITKDPATGAMKIDHDKCTLCGLCVEACDEQRTGCLRYDNDENPGEIIGMCDMCDGNPACVASCPNNVLHVCMAGDESIGFAKKADALAEKVWGIIYQVD